MGVGAGLYMYVVVVQKFAFAISSPDDVLSSSGFPECGAYAEKTFTNLSPKTNFTVMTHSLCLSSLTTLSTHFSATNIPTLSICSLLSIHNNLNLLPLAPKNLHPLLFHLVSCTRATSVYLSARTSTNSLILSESESTFQVPTLNAQLSCSSSN